MPDIPTNVIIHKLNVDPHYPLIKQKKKSFALERQKTIEEKVDKLLKVGFIKEIDYPNWITNVVMVKKINDK